MPCHYYVTNLMILKQVAFRKKELHLPQANKIKSQLNVALSWPGLVNFFTLAVPALLLLDMMPVPDPDTLLYHFLCLFSPAPSWSFPALVAHMGTLKICTSQKQFIVELNIRTAPIVIKTVLCFISGLVGTIC